MKPLYQTIALGLLVTSLVQCNVQTSENTSIKTLFISAEQKECSNGVGKQQCLLVKEKPTDQWSYFYSAIDGFHYQPGYDYILSVSTSKIANPPADASSIKYTLIKQLSKTKRDTN